MKNTENISPKDRFKIVNTPVNVNWDGQKGTVLKINPDGSAKIKLDNPVSGHVSGFGKHETDSFNLELKYIQKLTESINKKEKFENFLESLKKNDNKALIESVKKGFRACFESQHELRITFDGGGSYGIKLIESNGRYFMRDFMDKQLYEITEEDFNEILNTPRLQHAQVDNEAWKETSLTMREFSKKYKQNLYRGE